MIKSKASRSRFHPWHPRPAPDSHIIVTPRTYPLNQRRLQSKLSKGLRERTTLERVRVLCPKLSRKSCHGHTNLRQRLEQLSKGGDLGCAELFRACRVGPRSGLSPQTYPFREMTSKGQLTNSPIAHDPHLPTLQANHDFDKIQYLPKSQGFCGQTWILNYDCALVHALPVTLAATHLARAHVVMVNSCPLFALHLPLILPRKMSDSNRAYLGHEQADSE